MVTLQRWLAGLRPGGRVGFWSIVRLTALVGRVSPRWASYFLLLRQKKVTKEKATPLFATPELRFGATCAARETGEGRKLAALKHASFLSPSRCAARRNQKGLGGKSQKAKQPIHKGRTPHLRGFALTRQ